jgi:undecaprenyl-diphosphatase
MKTLTAPRLILRHLALGVILSIVFTIVFVRLFDFVEDAKNVTPFDRNLLSFMNHHRDPLLTQAATVLAHLGSPTVVVGIAFAGAVAGLIWRKVRGAAWTLPIAVIGAGIIIQSVKMLVQRPRPTLYTPLLHEGGFSFPSGHSLIAMVVYGLLGYFALGLVKNQVGRLAVRLVTVLLVFSIGLSRVYVQVHYPTDVLAGWTAGVPWLVACLGLHEVLTRRWPSTGEPILTQKADKSGDTLSAGAGVKTLLGG